LPRAPKGLDAVVKYNFGLCEHVCHLYRGHNELKELTLPLVRAGLRENRACVYVSDDAVLDDWYLEFQAGGIDVQHERLAGRLEVVPASAYRESCLRGSVVMAREVLMSTKKLLGSFTGVVMAGDSAWYGKPYVSPDKLCHWEATANVVFEGLNAEVVCQYDLDRYEPEFIHAALRTHQVVLYKGRRLENPFYQANDILQCEPNLNHGSNDPDVVAEMLACLDAPTP
jgi:MEDS: MEthanogen/methylotroph, DcmR Sensory domain